MDMERMTDYEVISWANRCSKPVDEIVDICTNCPYFQEQEEKDNGMGCQELMVLDLAERLEKTLPPDDRGENRKENHDMEEQKVTTNQSFGELVERMKNAVKEARENTVKGIREAVDALPLTDAQRCEILKARVEELEKQLEGRSEAFGNRVEELEGQLDECRKVRAQEREREFGRWETVNNLLKEQVAQNRDLVNKLNACLMTGAVRLVQVDEKWKAFPVERRRNDRLTDVLVKRLENTKQRAQVTCDSTNFLSINLEGRKK